MADFLSDIDAYMTDAGWPSVLDSPDMETGDDLEYIPFEEAEDYNNPYPDDEPLADPVDDHPSYMSGGRKVVWNSDWGRYVYEDYGMTSGTPGGGGAAASPSSPAAVSPSGGGGTSVSGGTSVYDGGGATGESDGSSTTVLGGAGGSSVASVVNPSQLAGYVQQMYNLITGSAQQSAATDLAAYQGNAEQQAASKYMLEMFSSGLSDRQTSEYSNRLRTAQSARGLAYGGASAFEEANLLQGMAEKQRAELLPQMLQKSQFEASLPAALRSAYTQGVYGSAASEGSKYGSLFASLTEGSSSSTTDIMKLLFGSSSSYYPFAG